MYRFLASGGQVDEEDAEAAQARWTGQVEQVRHAQVEGVDDDEGEVAVVQVALERLDEALAVLLLQLVGPRRWRTVVHQKVVVDRQDPRRRAAHRHFLLLQRKKHIPDDP